MSDAILRSFGASIFAIHSPARLFQNADRAAPMKFDRHFFGTNRTPSALLVAIEISVPAINAAIVTRMMNVLGNTTQNVASTVATSPYVTLLSTFAQRDSFSSNSNAISSRFSWRHALSAARRSRNV